MQLFPRSFEGEAPSEFGRGSNILKTRTYNLDVARDLAEEEIGGTCIWAYTATSLTANIDIRINDQLRDPLTFSQGMFIRGVPFSRLYVSHAAQAGETISIFYAVEQDARMIEIINPSSQFTNMTFAPATVLDTLADVALAAAATTQILPALATRQKALITNLVTNLNVLRIGDLNAGAARGIELGPGETAMLEATEAIYGYNPGPGAQSVGVAWTAN